ncbi:hypothetical protein OBBRIDRAFT_892030 [Obba rivulosa]|uniref:Uncharacterized protein n=1 Tax=Obba rivulosa TaxID=1052685 RepID=A0A8E2AIF7_9APHY|nr:hypothetical protein OBBRIDRAFT_892030 [Obba rivulosa]
MAQGLLDFTLENSSPMISYAPSISVSPGSSQTEWQINQTVDSLTYFTSHPGASLALQFYGSAIYLYGSASCPFNVTLDFETTSPPMTTEGFIYFNEDLVQELHLLNLTVGGTGGPGEEIIIDHATIVTEYTSEQSPISVVYGSDPDDHALVYQESWVVLNDSSIQTTSFEASVSVNFTGIAVAITGPSGVGSSFMEYGVLLDSWPAWSFVSFPVGDSDTTLFYQGGLDPTQEHSLELMNFGSVFQFNSITVWQTNSSSATPITSSPVASATASAVPETGNSNDSAVVKIVAPIVAVVGLLFLSAALWAFRRQRRQRRRVVPLTGPFALRFSRTFNDQKGDTMTLANLQPKSGTANPNSFDVGHLQKA